MEHVQSDVTEIKSILRDHDGKFDGVRGQIDSIRTTDFRITFSAIISVALGLAYLMARGFHWL